MRGINNIQRIQEQQQWDGGCQFKKKHKNQKESKKSKKGRFKKKSPNDQKYECIELKGEATALKGHVFEIFKEFRNVTQYNKTMKAL